MLITMSSENQGAEAIKVDQQENSNLLIKEINEVEE